MADLVPMPSQRAAIELQSRLADYGTRTPSPLKSGQLPQQDHTSAVYMPNHFCNISSDCSAYGHPASKLFGEHVRDKESNLQVMELTADIDKWPLAHDLFNQVRRRHLIAIDGKHSILQYQYSFEEICLKTLYNESDSDAPFDSDSPFWVVPFAIELARQIGIRDEDVLSIVAAK